jgi:hypothetical protein
MNKTIAKFLFAAVLVSPLGFLMQAEAATPPAWDVTGDYVVNMNYLGSDYAHDMTMSQDNLGNLTGNGGHPTGGSPVYTWVIDSGTVSGSDVVFHAHYTASADAVVPLTIMHATGTVAANGSMSGTWSDNYQGGTRSGTWMTASGTAALIGNLEAEDFGVVNYDTGLGILKGYTAGFGLTEGTLASSTSVVVKLYGAGDQLLQTNTANIVKFNQDITGTQFSSPFDVSGTFDYVTDGYWTNVREAEYGQSVPATKVVATVTLANGNVVTAENTMLVGDPTTIYPDIVTPPTPTAPETKDDCKNGGWKTFTNPTFKNQGQCVSSVAKNK